MSDMGLGSFKLDHLLNTKAASQYSQDLNIGAAGIGV